MKLRALTSSMLAIALSGAPVAAQAAAPVRASPPVAEANALEGENSTLLYILGAVAVGVILFLVLDDDDKDEPESP
jgi:hypothetical protein